MRLAITLRNFSFAYLSLCSATLAPVFAHNDASFISTSQGCGCHSGGTPQGPSGVLVIDNTTGKTVTSYVPGGAYRIRVSFTPQSAALVSYALSVVDKTAQTPAGTFSNSPVSGQSFDIDKLVINANSQTVGRSVKTAQPAGDSTVDINWTAPASGTNTLQFSVIRMEANGDGGSSGDRYGSAELTFLNKSGTNATTTAPTTTTTNGSSTSSGTSASGTTSQSSSSDTAFGNISGGCGLIKATTPTTDRAFYSLVLTLCLSIAALSLMRFKLRRK